jgi:hypothetical protein
MKPVLGGTLWATTHVRPAPVVAPLSYSTLSGARSGGHQDAPALDSRAFADDRPRVGAWGGSRESDVVRRVWFLSGRRPYLCRRVHVCVPCVYVRHVSEWRHHVRSPHTAYLYGMISRYARRYATLSYIYGEHTLREFT